MGIKDTSRRNSVGIRWKMTETQELALGTCLALRMRRRATTRNRVKMKKWVKRNVDEYKVVVKDMEEICKVLEYTAKAAEKERRENMVRWSDRTQKVGAMGSMNTPVLV